MCRQLTTKLTCRYGAQRNSGQVQRLVSWPWHTLNFCRVIDHHAAQQRYGLTFQVHDPMANLRNRE